jgi:hypothetical protein
MLIAAVAEAGAPEQAEPPASSRKVRSTLRRVAARLRDVAGLMEICAEGTAPERGAEHLLCVLTDLEPDIRILRLALRDSPPEP